MLGTVLCIYIFSFNSAAPREVKDFDLSINKEIVFRDFKKLVQSYTVNQGKVGIQTLLNPESSLLMQQLFSSPMGSGICIFLKLPKYFGANQQHRKTTGVCLTASQVTRCDHKIQRMFK